MDKLRLNKKRGFTLIEMMVSVSIFVIVAFIVTTTLLTLSAAYKKAQKMRLLMDNLNFSIQEMSLTFREGVNYQSLGNLESHNSAENCSLVPANKWLGGYTEDLDRICFQKLGRNDISGTSGIWRCEHNCPCSSPDDGYDIVSPEINIDHLWFTALPSWDSTDGTKKRIVINIQGTAGAGTKYATNFNIQTTAAQRSPNP